MKLETSAGGIIFSSKKLPLKVLLLKDKSGKWTFPKGLVEKNENFLEAAIREIGEEVGLKKLRYIADLKPVQYFYKWEGVLVKKQVQYFVFIYEGKAKPKPQISEGIMDVKWFTYPRALKVIGYKKTNKKLLKEAAEALIQK